MASKGQKAEGRALPWHVKAYPELDPEIGRTPMQWEEPHTSCNQTWSSRRRLPDRLPIGSSSDSETLGGSFRADPGEAQGPGQCLDEANVISLRNVCLAEVQARGQLERGERGRSEARLHGMKKTKSACY